MTIPSGKLFIKYSTLPGAGKGLYTKVFIPKGTLIAEYKGLVRRWNEIRSAESDNGYLMYVNRDHVVDAKPYTKALARYANDAKGIFRRKGIVNNACYEYYGLSVFIVAVKDIPAGSEIFVAYGKDYWKTIQHNRRIDRQQKRSQKLLPR